MATAGARGPVVALAALAALAGCGGAGTTVATTGSPDLAGSWHLVAGRDVEGTLGLQADREVTLVVKGADAGGTSACNHYGATVAVDGRSVSFGRLGGTEMACEPTVMELERRYLAGLQSVTSAERAGDVLTLTGPDVVLDFELDATVDDAALVGTTWQLESLLDGDAASSAVGGAEMVFADDGTFEGSTGCGPVTGSYELGEGSVTVTDLSAYRPRTGGCRRAAELQHEHVVALFSERLVMRVEGRRLTLTSQQGLGLVFRAE